MEFPQEFRGEWFETSQRCRECGVAVLEDSAPLAPIDDEVAYTCDGLTLLERTAVTADLMERRIPFRWEDGLVLVVTASAEDHVDRVLDDVLGDETEEITE